MPESVTHKLPSLKGSGGTASACKTALAVTYKALKAFSFYPEGHPLRERILLGAYQTMAQAAKEGMLSLRVQRNGFFLAESRTALDATPMTKALAQELFAREIQRIIVLPELTQADYNGFLALLALDPPKILSAGGLAALLKQHGIQTIALNEIDITAVFTRIREQQELEEDLLQEQSIEEVPQQATPTDNSSLIDHLSQMSVEELMALMSMEKDDNQYRQLARLLLAKGLPLKTDRDFDRLSTLLVGLVRQGVEPTRSAAGREHSLMVLQQLALGEMTEHLLDHLEDAAFERKETVFVIFRTLGAEAVDAVVRRLIAAGLKPSRKTFSTALLRIGPAAEPALFSLLKDGRWQVVLAAVATLAEMRSKDAVKGLVSTAYHSDNRVRMESIRALAGTGSIEATAALVELLRDPNQAIGMHAATWLGNTRNHRSLPTLLQLVLDRDLTGRSHPLKKEALLAVARIGDRRALAPLFRLVQRNHWVFPRRWNNLKLLAVEAIGHLGGEAAQDFLEGVAARGGQLARVSAATLETMAKRNADHHE